MNTHRERQRKESVSIRGFKCPSVPGRITAVRKGNRQARIVSLAPSVTSILVALGARRQLVGVSKWCPDVADVGRLPRLGDCWALDVDEVVRVRPTLVIGSVPYKAETVTKFLDTGLAFLATNPRSLADIYSDIRLLGGIVGRPLEAEELVRKMQQAFAAVARRAEAARGRKRRARVYCEAWPHPRITSPPWVAELVQLAGAEFVLPPGQRITDADVARAKPDVIVLAWAATGNRARPEKALAHPAWQDVPAVRRKQVYVVRDEWLNTPGPPLVRGVQELFRLLHL